MVGGVEVWGGWSFKGLELGRWEEVIVGSGLRCWCGIWEIFGLESGLLLREELVGFQLLHIEKDILL